MGRERAFPDAGLCLFHFPLLCLFHFPLRDCVAAAFVVYYKLVCLAQAHGSHYFSYDPDWRKQVCSMT